MLMSGFVILDDIEAAGLQIKENENGTLRIGESFGLICHTTAPRRPYWTRRGEAVHLVPPANGEIGEFGETEKSILEFQKLSLDDIGNYTCHASATGADELHRHYELKFKGIT